MKKIALIYNSLGHPELPYETSLRTELLRRQNNQLQFLVYSCTEADKDVLAEKSLLYTTTRLNTLKRLFQFSVLNPVKFSKYIFHQSKKTTLREALKQWVKFAPLIIDEPDVIHLMTAAYFPKIKDVIDLNKLIVSFRGADIVLLPMYIPGWKDCLREELFSGVGCVHFVSCYLRDESLKWGGKLENSKVIYIGIDSNPKVSGTRGVKGHYESILITTIGRLTWQKGYITALKAIRILKNMNYPVRYQIIGQGDGRSEVYFWRRELDLENDVEIAGFLTDDEKEKCLSSTDIYIQPSITEGLCVTVMEAMAWGIPVVASITGGIPETVIHGKTGILVNPSDPQALALALKDLIENEEMRRKMGVAAQKRIAEEFSLQHEADEWIKLYLAL
jgi:colanic acid/amylovoran biosynthesis glycosyltransferase